MLTTGLALALAAAQPPELDAARWAELAAASRTAHALPTVSDRARFGRDEVWAVAGPDGGDCEDKALLARQLLLASGWPSGALRLALARTETGELHAVLTAEVARGGAPATYVLDSRFARVLAWDALTTRGYRWISRQGADGRWRRITP